MAEITIDFDADLSRHFADQLKAAGYDPGDIPDRRKVDIRYFNVLKRKIRPRRRSVLQATPFQCPSSVVEGYNILVAKVEAGDDLNSHLSRKLEDSEYKDLLLFDWEIHHFHLDLAADASGFVNRTGELLFAIVTEYDFYSIAIKDHTAFTEIELLEIVFQNWPNLSLFRSSSWWMGGARRFQDLPGLRKVQEKWL